MNLRYFLILIFFVLALTPVLLFRAWPHSTVLENEFEEVHERHLLLARKVANSLEHYYQDVRTTFSMVALDPVAWGNASNFFQILENSHFRHICLVDPSTGAVMDSVAVASAPCPEIVPAKVLVVLNGLVRDGEINFGPVSVGSDGSNVMHIVTPLDNGLIAVGAIGTEYFRELGAAITFGERGHAAIVDHEGSVLSHPLPDWVADRRNIAKVPIVQRMLNGETGVDTFFSPALKGDMVAGFTSVQPAGWGVMVPQPVEELFAKAESARQSATYVMLIGVAGSLIFALQLSVMMARPLEQITLAAQQIAAGELSVPERAKGLRALPLEIRDLYQSFREMVVQLRKSISQVNTLAFVDSITGLANREYFHRRVDAFVDNANVGDAGALLFLDLDGFKAVNDTKGHHIGDVILTRVADRLCDVLGVSLLAKQGPEEATIMQRRNEVSIARLGGDEFAVFLPKADMNAAEKAAHDILHALGTPFETGASHISLGASIGIARFPDDATDFSGLLKAADVAMYDAKRNGKNQVQRYHKDITKRHDTRYDLADDLFSKEVGEQFDVFFQPVYRLSDTSLASVEGLLRWRHPTKGLLGPDKFLDIANDLGLKRRIDKMAFERSTEIMTEFANCFTPPEELSLNLSLERLLDKPYVDDIIATLPMPCKLSIELVESTMLDALDTRVSWSIDRLKDAGIGVMLDDFGSSHASISSLLDLGPDRIKLDGELVSRIESDQIATIVRSIIDMAHDLGVEVVAKGVEDISHLVRLREMGCDYAQGYALNAPMTQAEFMVYLNNANSLASSQESRR